MKILLTTCLLLITITTAHATIIEHGAYFTDSTTGIDWLNNKPLESQTYDSVIGGYGGYVTSGWRLANEHELKALLAEYVFPFVYYGIYQDGEYVSDKSHTFDSAAYFAAYHLVELLGINVSYGAPADPRAGIPVYDTGLTGIITQGYYHDTIHPERVSIFQLGAFDDSWKALRQVDPIFRNDWEYRYNTAGPAVSTILVRSVGGNDGPAPVPEPSTMLLLGGGLVGLAFWRKRESA